MTSRSSGVRNLISRQSLRWYLVIPGTTLTWIASGPSGDSAAPAGSGGRGVGPAGASDSACPVALADPAGLGAGSARLAAGSGWTADGSGLTTAGCGWLGADSALAGAAAG